MDVLTAAQHKALDGVGGRAHSIGVEAALLGFGPAQHSAAWKAGRQWAGRCGPGRLHHRGRVHPGPGRAVQPASRALSVSRRRGRGGALTSPCSLLTDIFVLVNSPTTRPCIPHRGPGPRPRSTHRGTNSGPGPSVTHKRDRSDPRSRRYKGSPCRPAPAISKRYKGSPCRPAPAISKRYKGSLNPDTPTRRYRRYLRTSPSPGASVTQNLSGRPSAAPTRPGAPCRRRAGAS
jgi:hypothetical protein